MTDHDYDVESVIEYQPFGGGRRLVLVTAREDDIKNGYPGFAGEILEEDRTPFNTGPNPFPECWGYDHQITKVVRR